MQASINLITVTTGRWDALDRMLRSTQCFRRGELRHHVIWLRDFGAAPPPAPIAERATIHAVEGVRSLSTGRNIALGPLDAGIVGFPDDDCWYPPGTLDRVFEEFERDRGLDGLSGRTLTEDGREVHARFHQTRHTMKKTDVPFCGNSNTMFFRGEFAKRVGEFDERLGVGSGTPFGGAEDWDYLMRGAHFGRVVFDPTLVVWHPMPSDTMTPGSMLRRSWRYAHGTGALYVKQKLPFWIVALWILRPQAGAAVAICKGQWHRAKQRLVRSLAMMAGAIRWRLHHHE